MRGLALLILLFAFLEAYTANADIENARAYESVRHTEEPIEVAQNRNDKIREDKSKPKKLKVHVSKNQPIYVKLIEASEVEYLGKHWSSQREKEQFGESTRKRIVKKVRDRLLFQGFASYAYDEVPEQPQNSEMPILLVIRLDKFRYGAQHRLASISVKIHNLNDPTFEYGTFVDAGTVNHLCNRIAQRFALSAK